jgi:nitrate reductase NapE component
MHAPANPSSDEDPTLTRVGNPRQRRADLFAMLVGAIVCGAILGQFGLIIWLLRS